ncbi:MAG TPA: hypothetical protein VFY96_02880, partial [Candidatus Binatia bacterium]|nr:hypothetical protein [Candidatus Binatia bacterium]
DVLTIPNMALRFKLPEEKNESQELLRQEQSRTAAPRVGARRTSRTGGAGSSAAARGRSVKVYLLRDGRPRPIEVQVGITDGSRTEVIAGELKENDPVIIGMSSSATGQTSAAPVNPFQPPAPRPGFR